MIHQNFNVLDHDRSLAFYKEALGLSERRRITAEDGSFIIVYVGSEASEFELELTWIRDMERPYDLGDEEFHLAFETDDFEAAQRLHEEMGCVAFVNEEMGIYFITDPDGYWLEILPSAKKPDCCRTENYKTINAFMRALSEGADDDISLLANASALLWEHLGGLNWAGFYIMKDGVLRLGPFQGKTACTMIEVGKGVCGTAVSENRTQLVYDVHEFPGHIACDAASNSEIVVPIRVNGDIYGVLDIDSPVVGRFTEEDREGLEEFVSILEEALGRA